MRKKLSLGRHNVYINRGQILSLLVHRTVTNPATTQEAVEMIDLVRSRVEQKQARFALFLLPQTKERRRGTYEEDVSAFPFFDVLDFFPPEPAALATIRFQTDTHWNRAGHAIAARAIVETLVQEGFIDRQLLKFRAGSR